MAKIITIANQKGGVAKTTTTFNIGTLMAEKGFKVLMIDNDPQSSLTVITGLNPDDYMGKNIFTLVEDERFSKDPREFVVELNENLSIIPSTIEYCKAESRMYPRINREYILEKIIKKISDDYDFILIDCLPSLGLLLQNALVASNYVVACVEPTYQPYKGLEYFKETYEEIKDLLSLRIKYLGVVVTKYRSKTNDHNDMLEVLQDENEILGIIPDSIEVSKGEIDGIPVVIRKPKHPTALAYVDLADKIISETK